MLEENAWSPKVYLLVCVLCNQILRVRDKGVSFKESDRECRVASLTRVSLIRGFVYVRRVPKAQSFATSIPHLN